MRSSRASSSSRPPPGPSPTSTTARPVLQRRHQLHAFLGEIGVAAEQHQAAGGADRGHRRPGDRARSPSARPTTTRTGSSSTTASSRTYSTTANRQPAVPVVHPDHAVRVGAAITFPKPVVFTYGFNAWRILPQTQVVGAPTGDRVAVRADPAAPPPENVGGDVKLATFNVLNFFPTTGRRVRRPVSAPAPTSTTARATRSRTTPAPQRSARCGQRRQPGAPAGQDRRGDQHRRRRHRLPRGARELGPVRASPATSRSTSSSTRSTPTPAPAPGPPCRRRRQRLPPLAEQDVIRNGFIYQPANGRARR